MRAARSAVVGLLLATSCQDGGCRIDEAEVVDVLSRSYCDGVYAHCDDGPGVSETSCDGRMKRGGDTLRDQLSELAFRYDPECALALRAAYEDDEIDTEPRFEFHPHARACPLWVGTRVQGEACTRVGDFDECAPRLQCSEEGICTDPRQPVAEGESCFGGDVTYVCDFGLTCNFGVCAVPPRLDEPCTERCAAGAICDSSDGRCIAAPSLGDACDGECDLGLECIEDVCERGRPAVCSMAPPWPPA